MTKTAQYISEEKIQEFEYWLQVTYPYMMFTYILHPEVVLSNTEIINRFHESQAIEEGV